MLDFQSLVTLISDPHHIASFMLGFLTCLGIKWTPKFLCAKRYNADTKKHIQNLNERLEASLAQIRNLQTELESKNKEIAVLEKKLYTRVDSSSPKPYPKVWRI